MKADGVQMCRRRITHWSNEVCRRILNNSSIQWMVIVKVNSIESFISCSICLPHRLIEQLFIIINQTYFKTTLNKFKNLSRNIQKEKLKFPSFQLSFVPTDCNIYLANNIQFE